MLIRSKKENALVEFNGNGVFWAGGYMCCACNGATVKLKATKDFQESSKLIDEIQDAFLSGERIFVIE